MSNISISIKGELLTSSTVTEQQALIKNISDKLSVSAQETIQDGFARSVQLSSYIGGRFDQEAVKAILRSLKVTVDSYDPIRLRAIFNDDYSHWYAGEELPEELAVMIQNIIDNSLQEWLKGNNPKEILAEVLGRQS